MSSLYNEAKILKLEEKLNIHFNDKLLLQRALTHKSFSNEKRDLKLKNNERLEFLGDSILNLSISTYIFKHFPKYPEGELAKIRAVVVSTRVLAEKSRQLGIGHYLLLGKGEELTGGRERESILADTMEAILGAIYIDHGFNTTKDFIINLFRDDIQAIKQGKYIKDYKTILQEIIQQNGKEHPVYSVVEEHGPDHNKTFVVQVEFAGKTLGSGTGSSKKEAEQQAAQVALNNLKEL